MKVSFALCVLVLLIAILHSAKHWLDREAGQFRATAIHWQSAVDQTKTRLEHALQLLENDQAFPYALGENQTHSVDQLLKSKEKKGEVTALGIYRGDCTLMTKSRFAMHPLVSCKTHAGAAKYYSSLRYDSGNRVASILVWTKIHLGRRSFWLVAETVLDKDWALRFDPVSEAVSAINLKVQYGIPSGYIAIKSIEATPPFYLVVKGSRLWQGVSRVMPPQGLEILLFVMIAVAFLLAVFVLYQLGHVRARCRWVFEDLSLWCQRLFTQDPAKVVLPKVMAIVDEWPEIRGIKHKVVEILAGYSKTIKFQNVRLERLEQRVKVLSEDLAAAAFELAKEPFLASLAKQVDDQGLHIKGELKGANSLLEDFSDVLRLALVPELQKLQDLSRNWKEGCRAYSPRKYLRTLSERPGLQGGDQLSDELEHLYRICHSSINIAINLSMQSHRAIGKTRRIGHFMEHWSGLSNANSHAEPASMLRPMITDSLKLVECQLRGSELALEGLEKIHIKVDDLNIPKFVWQSLFYHALLFLYFRAPSSPDGEVVIQIEFLKKGRERYLLLKSRGESTDVEVRGLEAQVHMELASKICKALPLNVEHLHSLKEEEVVSMSWQQGESRAVQPDRTGLSRGPVLESV